MHIILVRHGLTEWNGLDRFRGRADIDLNQIGTRQAEATAGRLASSGAIAVYTSPLKRALLTGRIVGDRLGIPVKQIDDLVDIDYGSWQGISTQEALDRDPDLHQCWIDRPHEAVFPNGEGLNAVRNRVSSVIDTILANHADETVILVSHVIVCRVIICLVLGVDNSHFWQIGSDVCSISTITTRNGRLVLHSLNDTCHLKNLSLND